jgi:hypothetical protein
MQFLKIGKCVHFPAKPMLWNNLKDYAFANDMPCDVRFKELDKRFPGSKFIFTDRELDSWLKSVSWHIENHKKKHKGQPLPHPAHREAYGFDYPNREQMIKYYNEHRKRVFDHFADRLDDLLTMKICEGDGWGRLLPFLGISFEQIPFFHVDACRPK